MLDTGRLAEGAARGMSSAQGQTTDKGEGLSAGVRVAVGSRPPILGG